MHQNNRIISWIISFLFSICMVISISYDQRDNWSLIICDKKHMISALIMTMILTMIVHMIMNVLYSKAGKSFIRLKTQANSGIGEKIFVSSSYSSSLEHSDCFMASKLYFVFSGLFNL